MSKTLLPAVLYYTLFLILFSVIPKEYIYGALISQVVASLIVISIYFKNIDLKFKNLRLVDFLVVLATSVFLSCLEITTRLTFEVFNTANLSILFILGSVIVAPIFEETIFRSIPYNLSSGNKITFFLSSIIMFTIVHIPPTLDLGISFIFIPLWGIIYSMMYIKYESLYLNIISHIIVNAVSLVVYV